MLSLGVLSSSQGRVSGGPISTFTWSDNGLSGTGYTRTYNAVGGSGTGARFTVTRSTTLGITSVTLFAAGTGYRVNDNLTVTETSTPFDVINITVTAVA
jgi:hypothetical protein